MRTPRPSPGGQLSDIGRAVGPRVLCKAQLRLLRVPLYLPRHRCPGAL